MVQVAIVRGIGLLLGFLTTFFLARLLGPSAFGQYSFFMASIAIAILPTESGLPTLVLRELSKDRHTGDIDNLIYWIYRKITLLACPAVFVLGVVTFYTLDQPLGPKFAAFFLIVFLLVLRPLLKNQVAMLSALSSVASAQSLDNIVRPASFMILLLLYSATFLNGYGPPIWHLLGLVVISVAVANFLGGMLLPHPRHVNRRIRRNKELEARWRKSLGCLTMVAAGQVVIAETDLIMLGILKSTAHVGVYRVIGQTALLLTIPLQIVNMVIAPQIARHLQNQNKLQNLASSSLAIIVLTSAPIFLVLAIYGTDILGLIFGHKYRGGGQAMLILILGQGINIAAGSVALFLNMSGHERITATGVVAAALVNIVLNAVLIPELGLEGAAVSSAISLAGWNLYLVYRLRVSLGIDSSIIQWLGKSEKT